MTKKQGGVFICIQCALKHFVATLERGDDPIIDGPGPQQFEGDMDAHVREFHPDPEAMFAERAELERRAQAGFERLAAKRKAQAAAAENN